MSQVPGDAEMWIAAEVGELDAGNPFELARGEHAGFAWAVLHNGMGSRCGYVRIPPRHPWARLMPPGRDDPSVGMIAFDLGDGAQAGWSWDGEIPARVHGGVNWACRAAGGGWWLGFDAGHAWDLPDLELPMSPAIRSAMEELAAIRERCPAAARALGMAVRGQAYMEDQCRSLCEQAAAAAGEG
jgi:hypothetical protein